MNAHSNSTVTSFVVNATTTFAGANEHFHKTIEDLVWQRDCSYMDAVLSYCATANVEVETGAALVKSIPVLKEALLREAETLRLVKATTNRLKF